MHKKIQFVIYHKPLNSNYNSLHTQKYNNKLRQEHTESASNEYPRYPNELTRTRNKRIRLLENLRYENSHALKLTQKQKSKVVRTTPVHEYQW